MFSSFRRKIAVLALAAVLVVPLAAAAGSRTGDGWRDTGSPLGSFSRIWAALTHIWSDLGCSIDPFGRCADEPPTPASADNGCAIDPYGRCVDNPAVESSEDLDLGCSIDPYGRCIDNPAADAGCIIDPYGGCSNGS